MPSSHRGRVSCKVRLRHGFVLPDNHRGGTCTAWTVTLACIRTVCSTKVCAAGVCVLFVRVAALEDLAYLRVGLTREQPAVVGLIQRKAGDDERAGATASRGAAARQWPRPLLLRLAGLRSARCR